MAEEMQGRQVKLGTGRGAASIAIARSLSLSWRLVRGTSAGGCGASASALVARRRDHRRGQLTFLVKRATSKLVEMEIYNDSSIGR